MTFLPKDVKRFVKKFVQGPPNECWEWTANVAGRYGQFRGPGGKSMPAHRFSYLLYVGKIPNGLLVCHTCDNPLCINPSHLFLGTASDNAQDMIAKGRQGPPSPGPGEKACKGEQHGLSKLTTEDVIEIRRRYRRLSYHNTNARQLAIEFGVGQDQITRIVRKQRWKHV